MSPGADAALARFAPAPGKLAVMAVGLAVFAGLAVWVLWITPAEAWQEQGSLVVRVALWGVALICPVWAADLALRLVRGTPTLAATADGLVLRAGFGARAALGWDEIALVAPVEMGRKFWLAIYLRAPRAALGRLGLLARLMLVKSHGEGVPNFALRYYQLGVAPETAAGALEAIRQNPGRAARHKGRARR
ncbi:MAG TPA: hypothetical protein VMM59_02845 [Thermohalobaculum sp.]|nr:hypothetical protein [Thermohalobaculum sp.]